MLKFLACGFVFINIALLPWQPIAANNLPTPNLTEENGLDKIIAVVNNDIITETEFNRALAATKQQFVQNHVPLPDEKTFKEQVLNQLIYQKLQLQLAKRNNITASDTEVNNAIKDIANRNHISLAELKQKLAQDGIAYKEFYKQIREQIIISKIQHQALNTSINVTKAEIADFREKHQSQLSPTQYYIETILIPVNESANKNQINEAKMKATQLLTQLKNGGSFSEAMKSHPGSASLGWRDLNDLPQIFANRVPHMKVGEIAGPIQAQNGFHLIILTNKQQKGGGYTDQQIQQILFQQKAQKELQSWLEQLKKTAYIHINTN